MDGSMGGFGIITMSLVATVVIGVFLPEKSLFGHKLFLV